VPASKPGKFKPGGTHPTGGPELVAAFDWPGRLSSGAVNSCVEAWARSSTSPSADVRSSSLDLLPATSNVVIQGSWSAASSVVFAVNAAKTRPVETFVAGFVATFTWRWRTGLRYGCVRPSLDSITTGVPFGTYPPRRDHRRIIQFQSAPA